MGRVKLSLKDYIVRSYLFLAEATFKCQMLEKETSRRKSLLIRKWSAQICKVFHQHGIAEKDLDLASLAKWLSVRLRTKWLWVRVPLSSHKLQIWRLLRARSSLTFSKL